jgi:hypothetical protein
VYPLAAVVDEAQRGFDVCISPAAVRLEAQRVRGGLIRRFVRRLPLAFGSVDDHHLAFPSRQLVAIPKSIAVIKPVRVDGFPEGFAVRPRLQPGGPVVIRARTLAARGAGEQDQEEEAGC